MFSTQSSRPDYSQNVYALDQLCIGLQQHLHHCPKSIFNITGQRIRNVAVTVSMLEENIMDTGDNRCGYIDGFAQQFDNLVTCNQPMVGQYVQLQILDTSMLSLLEVGVHGY